MAKKKKAAEPEKIESQELGVAEELVVDSEDAQSDSIVLKEDDAELEDEESWCAMDSDSEEDFAESEFAETDLAGDSDSDASGFGASARTPYDGSLMEEMLSLEAKVEAILFASPKPVKPAEIEELIGDEGTNSKDIVHALDRLTEFYETRSGGFKLEYLKNLGYQFRTVAAAGPIMERMFSSRPRPLSRAAMETLAIIAYRQPTTRAEIEFIRGVDAGSILKNLLERDLVKCVGRKADAGRPMVFGTTDEFLRVFRLGSLEELPSLDSFQTDPELIKTAMEKLNSEEAVSVEGFIADEGGAVSEEELDTIQSQEESLELTPELDMSELETEDTPSPGSLQ